MPSPAATVVVVRARHEGDDPQQFLAARGQLADGRPQRAPLIVDDGPLLASQEPGPASRRSQSWSAGSCLRPAARTRHASRRVVVTSQAVSAAEVVDAVQMGEQAHPGPSAARPAASPALSPAARATCHSSGLSSATIWPTASSLPSLAALTRPAILALRADWPAVAGAVADLPSSTAIRAPSPGCPGRR